ncbi:MAG: hypothetical protein VX527_09420 [Planctomycetota bacterium]|nr:hypothetical protein [Planctomycetota bacterium]
MRNTVLPILLLAFMVGCQKPISNDGRPPILTKHDQLPHFVGELVTLQGRVSQAKIPQIIGVDVGLDGEAEPGDYAEATGVLFTWHVTAESHAAMLVMGDHVATRGPGTYYSVVVPTALSAARPVLDSPAGPLGSTPLDGPASVKGEIEIEEVFVEEEQAP